MFIQTRRDSRLGFSIDPFALAGIEIVAKGGEVPIVTRDRFIKPQMRMWALAAWHAPCHFPHSCSILSTFHLIANVLQGGMMIYHYQGDEEEMNEQHPALQVWRPLHCGQRYFKNPAKITGHKFVVSRNTSNQLKEIR